MRNRLLSLRYRIVISVVLIEAVMLSIMVWSNVSQVRQIHQDRLDQSIQVILQQFTATAGRYLFEVDQPSLQEYSDRVVTQDELVYLFVEDANKVPRSMSGSLPDFERLHAGLYNMQTKVRDVHTDIVQGKQYQGVLHLGYTTSVMDAAVASALRRGALIAGIEIILSIAAALFIGGLLTRNLERLAEFAQRYGRGEHDLTVPIKSRDETGMVAGAFNEMVHQRQAAEAQKRISEARQAVLQNELLHASRLSAMGQLSAQIAHEINQPLAAIMNYLHAGRQIIESRAGGASDAVVEILDKAIKQTDRTASIISQIRRFVSTDDADRGFEDINDLVTEAVDLALMGVPSEPLTQQLNLATDLPPVLVNKTQIIQVVVNLVRNAVEAMADSPTRHLTIETARSGDDKIEICVGDTGPGITAEIAGSLFQSFVSTKQNGMGIGLSISQSFIEAHGGQLRTVPSKDFGTMFSFTLPIAQKECDRDVA